MNAAPPPRALPHDQEAAQPGGQRTEDGDDDGGDCHG
jgi:hypothetical protein